MLCQHCKKNQATVTYKEVVNGREVAYHFCASCDKYVFGDLNDKYKTDIWAGLFGTPSKREKVCPVCKTTFADYERTGLLGCTSCYDVFKDELLPSILGIQGRSQHIGKTGNNNDELGLHRKIKILQEKLEQAVREHRFGDANNLNNQIEAIKSKLYGGGDE